MRFATTALALAATTVFLSTVHNSPTLVHAAGVPAGVVAGGAGGAAKAGFLASAGVGTAVGIGAVGATFAIATGVLAHKVHHKIKTLKGLRLLNSQLKEELYWMRMVVTGQAVDDGRFANQRAERLHVDESGEAAIFEEVERDEKKRDAKKKHND